MNQRECRQTIAKLKSLFGNFFILLDCSSKRRWREIGNRWYAALRMITVRELGRQKRCPDRLSNQTLICHDPVVSRHDLVFWASAATSIAVPGRVWLNLSVPTTACMILQRLKVPDRRWRGSIAGCFVTVMALSTPVW